MGVAIQEKGFLVFNCPGCAMPHQIKVDGEKKWEWNGSLTKPTIRPSLLVFWKEIDDERRCHSYIENGQIRFLNDCGHGLAGQTVELEEFEW